MVAALRSEPSSGREELFGQRLTETLCRQGASIVRSWRFLLCLASFWSAVVVADPALDRLRTAATAGDGLAQLNLAAAYDHGLLGLAADPSRAVMWYRRAAEQGLAEAEFNLAHCLATGHGAPIDLAGARVWMVRAARQGLADAQFLYGVMLTEGLGGPVESARGLAWLRRAAAQGQADAADYLSTAASLPD